MPRTLSFGSTGPEVRQLQEGLNKLPTKLAALVPDGQFGSRTRSRVVEFQGGHQLAADGIVGPMTWSCCCGCCSRWPRAACRWCPP